MRTPLTVTAVAATGLLLVGGGTALALGHGGAPAAPATVTAVPAAAVTPTGSVLPPELPRTAAAVPAPPAAPAVDRAAAERIALDAVGGGRVTGAEFDRHDDDRDDDRSDDRSDDRDHWEIEIRDGAVEHDVDVDAATGQVLDHDTDTDTDDDRSGDDRDDRGHHDGRDDD
ncbi:PepSY domain-containing protein [Pseudonocardia spirodelae]|uniref:PepSY domain-containing protein n=1 Tax=Pseudonocardia spirodelae TaxID=3133431 RepID=A0ABU8T9A7_9PSEU